MAPAAVATIDLISSAVPKALIGGHSKRRQRTNPPAAGGLVGRITVEAFWGPLV
jgi:hypothetical protein